MLLKLTSSMSLLRVWVDTFRNEISDLERTRSPTRFFESELLGTSWEQQVDNDAQTVNVNLRRYRQLRSYKRAGVVLLTPYLLIVVHHKHELNILQLNFAILTDRYEWRSQELDCNVPLSQHFQCLKQLPGNILNLRFTQSTLLICPKKQVLIGTSSQHYVGSLRIFVQL